jgi:hypothetical protein
MHALPTLPCSQRTVLTWLTPGAHSLLQSAHPSHTDHSAYVSQCIQCALIIDEAGPLRNACVISSHCSVSNCVWCAMNA